jgi:2-oxoisovalerate dehydrogenase E1 component
MSRDGLTAQQVEDRTGITSRRWASTGEDAVSMAAQACRNLLNSQHVTADQINLLICTTTTPKSVTPSTACQVLAALTGAGQAMIPAYDINAACSGYLYAIQAGYDFLKSRPEGRVLVVTAEMLSPLLDPADQDTVFLFGDASSATLLVGEAHIDAATARLYQPDLCAKADVGENLCVPLAGDGFIHMNGRKVFAEAVRSMLSSLNRACQAHGLSAADLNLIVPHQANDRITSALQRRVGVDVYSNICTYGNTSSTSIPLCLTEVFPALNRGARVGLCAFGGGFTFGAAILEVLRTGTAVQSGDDSLRKAS